MLVIQITSNSVICLKFSRVLWLKLADLGSGGLPDFDMPHRELNIYMESACQPLKQS